MPIERIFISIEYNFRRSNKYRGSIINLEIGLVIIKIKGKEVMMNFNILLLGNNKAVLRIP